MGLGHPGVVHPSPSWKPLALNSTTNAGSVAVSDGATSVASRSRENSRKSQDIEPILNYLSHRNRRSRRQNVHLCRCPQDRCPHPFREIGADGRLLS